MVEAQKCLMSWSVTALSPSLAEAHPRPLFLPHSLASPSLVHSLERGDSLGRSLGPVRRLCNSQPQMQHITRPMIVLKCAEHCWENDRCRS